MRPTTASVAEQQEHLRLLAIQTISLPTSEVRVLHGLLDSVHRLAREKGIQVDVLLLQGVDRRAGRESGYRAAAMFREIPNVTIQEVNMGNLGRRDSPRFERAMKVRDLVNVQRSRSRLYAVARSFQPDVVYSAQQLWDLRIATPLARNLACPQVIHLHYNVGPALGRGVVDTLRRARMVLAVSEFIRDDAIDHGVHAGRVHALYNSIAVPKALSRHERNEVKSDLRAQLGLTEDALLVGMTARLSPSKGQVQLVEAMLPLLQGDRRIQLLLAGSEDPARNGMTDRIRQTARAHGVTSQVHLLGQRSDVPRILDALDVFAHPTRQDPCPLAVLEAAAHGLPVVAWREGGTATLVSDRETGLLVEPLDIAELTRALHTLIFDQDARAMMGRKARERVASVFRPDLAAASFLALLQEAAGHEPYRAQRHGPVIMGAGL